MSNKNPYTKIEVIEERHPKQPEDSPLVKVSHVLVNGAPVRIAKDGIFIDYGHDEGDGQNVVRVSLEFLVDEFSIRQVPNGYTDGKTSTSTGDRLHFSGHLHCMPEEEFTKQIKRQRRLRKSAEDFNNDDFD